MHFAISGVDCPVYLPPLAAFLISMMTATAGVSGAFLLLPFQMSVLGFTNPAVTPTNLLYNAVAGPGGVYGYASQRRMHWRLAGTLIAGTLPGIFLGAILRVRYLPDARSFKFFAGWVLLYVGVRLLWGALRKLPCQDKQAAGQGRTYNPVAVVALAIAVGLIGGIYGIGGGAIIAPVLVARFGAMTPVRPDWVLGILFGAGGLAGTYAGAHFQKFLPERLLRSVLGALVTLLALSYVVPYLFG